MFTYVYHFSLICVPTPKPFILTNLLCLFFLRRFFFLLYNPLTLIGVVCMYTGVGVLLDGATPFPGDSSSARVGPAVLLSHGTYSYIPFV